MTPPSTTTRRPYQRQRTEQLTVDAIVAASLELIEEQGFDALSMRLLGERLSVSHMAIYHHVSGKQRLQELVADAVLSRVELPGPEVDDWVERLTLGTTSFRSELLRYPGLADFVIHQHHVTEAARPLYEYTITTLLEAGFDPVDAALGREALFALAPYYLTHAQATRTPAARKRKGKSRWAPEVAEALTAAAEVDALDRWTFANRLVLEGLRARLADGGAKAPARKKAAASKAPARKKAATTKPATTKATPKATTPRPRAKAAAG